MIQVCERKIVDTVEQDGKILHVTELIFRDLTEEELEKEASNS